MIIVHAMISVQPAHRAEFLEHAKQAVQATRTEAGNLGYRLVEDVEHPNQFLMIEQWQDATAVDAHAKSPHFLSFVQAVKAFLAAPLNPEVYEVQGKGQ